MTQPDTPGRRFVSTLLGDPEGQATTSADAEDRSWLREFWTAMAGRAGAGGDSARSSATSSPGDASTDVGAETTSNLAGSTDTAQPRVVESVEADDLDAPLDIARLAERRGDLTEAEAWYRRAAHSDDRDALLGLARLLERRGDLAEAEAWYRRATERWPTETRINESIRVPEVRLVGPNGEQVGIVRIEDALRLAQEADLDLVEVAAQARPPVCKLMDFGKFKYETAQKARESRRSQQMTITKEQKLRPKLDAFDYQTKKRNIMQFLEAGHKVKVTIMLQGREQSRPELGFRLLQRLSEDVADLGFVETSAKQDGRNMTMVLAPHRNKPRTPKIDQDDVARSTRQRAE